MYSYGVSTKTMLVVKHSSGCICIMKPEICTVQVIKIILYSTCTVYFQKSCTIVQIFFEKNCIIRGEFTNPCVVLVVFFKIHTCTNFDKICTCMTG